MRIFLFVFGLLLLGTPAQAATITFDLTGMITTESFFPPCYCNTSIYYSPIVSVPIGTTVDFGQVTTYAYESGLTPDAGPDQQLFFLISSVAASYDPLSKPFPGNSFTSCDQGDTACITNALSWSDTFDLKFSSSTGTVQIGWFGDSYGYSPPALASPVPEPSTWAMLLIGFAAIGFAGYRRSRRANFMARMSLMT
jgi:PEP-CTERM motif